MSSVFDALPAIVPFFGVLLSSFTVGFCVLNRRMRSLTNRIADLEQRQAPSQIVIDRPPPPVLTPPPIYPSYPVQQQQYSYPYYQQNPQPSAPSTYQI